MIGTATRERIIAAYKELAQQRGFRNPTMDELAAQVGMSKRTIYRYFRSKEEIIETIVDQFLQSVGSQIEVLLAEDKRPQVLFPKMVVFLAQSSKPIFNPLVLDDLRRHYPYLWARIDQFRVQRIQHALDVIVAEGQAERIKQIDPRIIRAAVLAAIQAVVNPSFILDNNLTVEQAAGQLIQLFMYGVVEQSGRQ